MECMSRTTVPLCALVLVLVASSNPAPARTIVGTVLAFAPGQSLIVVNEQTDPSGLEFPLRGMLVDPHETLAEIRDVAARVLPGAAITRRLMFRYTLVWTKPYARQGTWSRSPPSPA